MTENKFSEDAQAMRELQAHLREMVAGMSEQLRTSDDPLTDEHRTILRECVLLMKQVSWVEADHSYVDTVPPLPSTVREYASWATEVSDMIDLWVPATMIETDQELYDHAINMLGSLVLDAKHNAPQCFQWLKDIVPMLIDDMPEPPKSVRHNRKIQYWAFATLPRVEKARPGGPRPKGIARKKSK